MVLIRHRRCHPRRRRTSRPRPKLSRPSPSRFEVKTGVSWGGWRSARGPRGSRGEGRDVGRRRVGLSLNRDERIDVPRDVSCRGADAKGTTHCAACVIASDAWTAHSFIRPFIGGQSKTSHGAEGGPGPDVTRVMSAWPGMSVVCIARPGSARCAFIFVPGGETVHLAHSTAEAAPLPHGAARVSTPVAFRSALSAASV